MFDARTLLVLLVVIVTPLTNAAQLGARSTGKAGAVESQKRVPESAESTDLRQLVDEIKRYLHRDDDVKPAAAPSAYDDVRTVYAAGTLEQDVNNALSDGSGYWTKWIDADPDPSMGLGEFEDCTNIKWKQNREGRCLLGCKNPLAARYSAIDSKIKATWAEIEGCIGPMDSSRVSSCGFRCINEDAKKFPKTSCDTARCIPYGLDEGCVRCPDVRVQFFCLGEQPDENRCCPYSSQCMAFKDDLEADIRAIEDTVQRHDVIAGILANVKQVLEDEDTDKAEN
jgi:hypothetical protein